MPNYRFPEKKKEVLEKFNDKASYKHFDIAYRLSTPEKNTFHVKENKQDTIINISRNGAGPLETPFGEMWMFNFRVNDQWEKYTALVKCQGIDEETLKPIFKNPEHMMIRIDSGCETG